MSDMIQARQSNGDSRLYAPNRDVAHLFQPMMHQVAAWIEDGNWPVLAEFLKKNSIEPDALGEACAKMCRLIGEGAEVQYRKESCVDALKRSGFLGEPIEAQLAVLASIGAVVVGVAHKGLREASLGTDGPMKTIGELLEDSDRLLAKFYDRQATDA